MNLNLSFSKVIYSFLLVLMSAICSAQTTFYVASDGNDTALGTSEATAWKTLSKVSAQSFSSGDVILFKRGQVFQGKLRITSSGVTVDAYGTGAAPILSGAEQINTTWTVYSGNIWETTFAAAKPAQINNLFKANSKLPISRHPNPSVNNGYFNLESHSGLTQFTDNELSGAINWTGAELVLRSERWRVNRTQVLTHSGNTLTIPSSSAIANVRDGYGYFFVNDVKAADTEGEWAYNATTGKVYLYSAANPNSLAITFPRVDTVMVVKNAANVTIRNLDIKYGSRFLIFLASSSQSMIENVKLSHSGGDGINYTGCVGGTLQNSQISYINNTGVFANTSNSSLKFLSNEINNIGDVAYAKSKTFIGLDCNSPNSEIWYNKVSKTGYTGILSAGLNNLVKRNVVDSACLFLEDMAGIYTNFNNGANSGMVIEENFVFNTIGERLGAPEAYSMANGIYVDNLSTGVTVRNNTVAFVKGMGLYTNFNNTGNELHNNTSFSSGVNELNVHKPNSAPGYVMAENILVANVTDPNHDVFNSNVTFDFTFEDMGYYTNNYVINPYSDKTIEVSYKDNGFKRIERFTPYEWEATAPQINGTISSPVKYTSSVNPNDVIKFYYNKTQSTQTYTLPSGRFIDAKNVAYCGTTALAPYTSVILFKVDDNACSGPSVCSHTLSVNVDSLAGSSVKLSWNAITESLNYDIRYKPEADSVWKYAHNVRDTSFVLTNLLPKTYYAYELRVSCYGKEGDWQTFPAFKSQDYAGEHVFINATLENCSPASSFSAVHSTTDNKWTIQNSGGVGTVDKDYLTSNSAVENSPEFTLNAVNQLDPCATYDIYIYYLSPITQPWKIKARLNTDSAFVTYDRFTLGAELLTDYTGTATSNRLYRAKIGTLQGQSDISVVFDDIYYGVSSSRSVLDGIGFRKTSNNVPSEPDSLHFSTLSPSSIQISWKDNAVDETGYIVERKNGSSSFVQIASLGSNTQTYLDTTAIAGKFSYRVYATKGSCRSPFSNMAYVDNTTESLLKANPKKNATEVKTVIEIIAYPNPSEAHFVIGIPKSEFKYNGIVLNSAGKLIYKFQVNPLLTQFNIDLSKQPTGIYLIELSNGMQKYQRKLIKK